MENGIVLWKTHNSCKAMESAIFWEVTEYIMVETYQTTLRNILEGTLFSCKVF